MSARELKVLTLLVVAFVSLGPRARCNPTQVPLLEHFQEVGNIMPSLSYRIMRFQVDVTGDDLPELFLAHSRSGGSGGIEEWIVYSPTPDGKYRLLDIVGFSYLGFRVSSDPLRFHAFYKSSNALVTYSVDATGFHEQSREENADPESEEFEAWRKTANLKVLVVDLQELVSSANPAWMDILKNEPAPGVGKLEGVVVVQ